MNDWKEWEKRQRAKVISNIPKPQAKSSQGEPIAKRQITKDELDKLKRLRKVSTAWWCGDSRFIRQLEHADADTQITERQAWYIDVLYYKYRKQLNHSGQKPAGYGS